MLMEKQKSSCAAAENGTWDRQTAFEHVHRHDTRGEGINQSISNQESVLPNPRPSQHSLYIESQPRALGCTTTMRMHPSSTSPHTLSTSWLLPPLPLLFSFSSCVFPVSTCASAPVLLLIGARRDLLVQRRCSNTNTESHSDICEQLLPRISPKAIPCFVCLPSLTYCAE